MPGVGLEAKGKAVSVEGRRRQSRRKRMRRRRNTTWMRRQRWRRMRIAEEESEEGEKWLGHYSSTQSILLVGDGNFSFSLALATAFGSGANIVATSLDTYEALRNKYCKAESNIMNLERLGATVFHGVDVKTMKFHTDLKNRRFDRIVYNFPHAGFKGKEHEVHMIKLHKKLVRGYFRNARHLIRPCGEIHVSHKTGASYDKWDLERVAAEFSLILAEKVDFQKAHYPGYNQKKGDGPRCDEPFPLGTCFTFKFKIGDLKDQKKQNQRRAGAVSSIRGSTRPFHPPPLVQALPGLDFRPPVNTVLMPMTLLPHVDVQRQPPGFALHFSSVSRAPYFHQPTTVHPVLSMPGPSLNALGSPGGIPPPVGRITSISLLDPPGHPWYEQGFIAEPLGRTDYFLAQEYQRSLQREYKIQRQMMPGATSMNYSAFLEQRHRESVQRQEWLLRMIAYSCR